MMNLKNMAVKSAENNDVATDAGVTSRYGYGLNIRLNDEQMKLLGIPKPIKAGTKIILEAHGIVESTHESVEGKADADADNVDIGMSIQITDLALEEGGETPNPAEVLYTKS